MFGDVWLAYAAIGDRPNDGPAPEPDDGRVDLLLNPHRHSNSAALAMEIRERLRREIAPLNATAEEAKPVMPEYRLSYNDTHVVVRLSFPELIRVALPMTKWWQNYVCKYLPGASSTIDADSNESTAVTESAEIEKTTTLQQIVKLLSDPDVVKTLIGYLENPDMARASALQGAKVSYDLIWIIRLVGTIARKVVEKRKTDKHSPLKLIEATRKLLEGCVQPDPVGLHLWSVSLNRPVTISTSRSTATIKADAARLLFTPKSSSLCWAIIDSGIDATHIAFRKFDKNGVDKLKAPFVQRPNRITNNTRVVNTYDFTKFRKLLEIPIGDESATVTVDTNDENKARATKRALMSGRMLPWDELADVLRVEYKPDAFDSEIPKIQHGTHVAGILAADWRPGDTPGPPGSALQGVCPDINLYDLRVVDDSSVGAEFNVIAALQFIRFINSSKDQPVIHGVNISMSIPHDVSNYACGRTPICDECDRLVGSGVVVVAAAGNLGYAQFTTDNGQRSDGYRAVSITDPGNAELVITVGATHRTHPHRYGVSYFSSRGPTGDGRPKPDLLAPGEKIMAPVPNGDAKALDGTSMAAPHVSGAAALLMARHPELMGRPADIKRILCSTATDLGRTPEFQGSGMLDVLRALQSV